MTPGTVLMNAEEIGRALSRMAHQILDTGGEAQGLALCGIHSRGVPLARRLARTIAETTGQAPPVGILDINLYRDDLSRAFDHPVVRRTEIPFALGDRRLVLVDDVLYTGRTIRAALDALMDLGRPRAIRLAVLIDRGGRELPIHADVIGRTFMVGPEQLVDVRLTETDGGPDEVVLRSAEPRAPRHAPRHAPPVPAVAAPAPRRGKKAAKKKAAPKRRPTPRGGR